MTDFQMDLKLQRLAAISFAASFVKNFNENEAFDKCHFDKTNFYRMEYSTYVGRFAKKYKEYVKFIKKIFKELEKLNLPKNILDEVKYVIHHVLMRLIEWYKTMKRWFGFCYIDLRKLHWTCHGTIDSKKVVSEEWATWFDADGEFKKNYEEYFDSDLSKSSFKSKFAMYYMACVCAITDYVDGHFEDMFKFWKNYRNSEQIKAKSTFLCDSIFFLIESEKIRLLEDDDEAGVVKANLQVIRSRAKKNNFLYMFKQACSRGYDIAALYYFKLLKPEEKDKELVQSALDCFLHRGQIRFQDLVAFLVLEMSEDQKQQFFFQPQEHFYPETWKLMIWLIDLPWEDLFIEVFHAIKIKLCKQDCAHLLKDIIYKMTFVNQELGCDFRNTVYWRMFIAVFDEIRRRSTTGEPHLIPEFSDGAEFVDLFDMQVLKLVLESECRNDNLRKDILTPTYDNIFGKLARENEFERIEEFTKVVLKSDDERQWFKKFSDWHGDFINEGDFESLDKLLDWQCDSPDEREKMKYDAVLRGNLLTYCGKLYVEGKLEEAEEAKKWGLLKEEHVRYYADRCKKTEDLEWLSAIWSGSFEEPLNFEQGIEKAKNKTTEFLKWFLETDEDLTVFIDEKLIEETNYFCYGFPFCLSSCKAFAPPCKVFIELLKFCFSSEHLTSFKEKMAKNINIWFRSNSLFIDVICDANIWMDFIFEDDAKKRGAVRNFLLSGDKYTFFDKLFSSRNQNTVDESTLEWLSLWIKMAVDENGMDNYFNDLSSHYQYDRKFIGNLNSLRSVVDRIV